MRQRHLVTVFALLCILGGMGTLVAYAVPLYQLFCQVTGYGGTTQVATGPAARVLDRTVTVRFNADRDENLPWRFESKQNKMQVRVGEPALALFQAESRADEAVVGTATFNVTPAKAGQYFNKIECFCFTEQVLEPGQVMDMPVQFFIDPSIADDRNLDDVKTITLSYTFFRAIGKDAGNAQAARSTAGRPATN